MNQSSKPQTYYEILDLSLDADDGQIARAYRNKKAEFQHDPAQLQQIEKAYQTLSNPTKRKAYLQQDLRMRGEADTPGGERPSQPLPDGLKVASSYSLTSSSRKHTEIVEPEIDQPTQPSRLTPSSTHSGRGNTVIIDADQEAGPAGIAQPNHPPPTTTSKAFRSPYVQVSYHDYSKTFELRVGENVIGRLSESGVIPTIPLPDPEQKYISRKHAIIYVEGANCSIIDQSANGTFLNGQRLIPKQSYPLKDRDVITIEGRELVVRLE